jgi:formylglycine-generating enzyme
MDEHVVTNAEFSAFVKATGYVTVAERKVDWEELKKRFSKKNLWAKSERV